MNEELLKILNETGFITFVADIKSCNFKLLLNTDLCQVFATCYGVKQSIKHNATFSDFLCSCEACSCAVFSKLVHLANQCNIPSEIDIIINVAIIIFLI